MVNSTQVGTNENAAVINSWWLFTTFDGENGEQHHAAHSSLYMGRAIPGYACTVFSVHMLLAV